jgi:hypothetical protein
LSDFESLPNLEIALHADRSRLHHPISDLHPHFYRRGAGMTDHGHFHFKFTKSRDRR